MQRALGRFAWAAAATLVWHLPTAGAATCRAQADVLRERLETVVESVIDGRTGQVPATARRVDSWWRSHRSAFPAGADADARVDEMRAAARAGKPVEAARAAVLLADASMQWCEGPPRTSDQLMIVDLTGMTGWLRSHGAELEWPGDARKATEALAHRLEARRRPSLARRLRDSVALVLQTPARARGDAGPSGRLLDLVDVTEGVLR